MNRLCAEIAGKYKWAFVNVNMRPYYAEGQRLAFEIAEQLNWKLPQHTVAPMASGSLLTKIHKGYQELIGWASPRTKPVVHGAQATGCSPISAAYKDGRISSSRSSRTPLPSRSPSARRRTAFMH